MSRPRPVASFMALAVAGWTVLWQVAPGAATARPVDFTTEDGVTVAATLHEASRQPAPAVVLLHMLTRSRDDWRVLGGRLADAGIHALAIDFRGHGGSGRGPASADGQPDLARLVLDARAAVRYLAGRPDLVRPSAIGIAGASVGANVAVLAASAEPGVRSLALLSVGLDYRSLRVEAALKKLGDRPVLLVAGSDDPYASRSQRELAATGAGREALMLEGAGHGTVMLSRAPGLPGRLVDWFLRTLL